MFVKNFKSNLRFNWNQRKNIITQIYSLNFLCGFQSMDFVSLSDFVSGRNCFIVFVKKFKEIKDYNSETKIDFFLKNKNISETN